MTSVRHFADSNGQRFQAVLGRAESVGKVLENVLLPTTLQDCVVHDETGEQRVILAEKLLTCVSFDLEQFRSVLEHVELVLDDGEDGLDELFVESLDEIHFELDQVRQVAQNFEDNSRIGFLR